jgi:AcrR family transcriptional regulator
MSAPVVTDRVSGVLESALRTFARQGYRKSSMDDVARQASISRPGLYLHFSSKQDLLRAAVEHALARDVAQAEALLGDGSTPLPFRLVAAFDLWAGQYVGPLAADIDRVLDEDAALLGDLPAQYSARFGAALLRALTLEGVPSGLAPGDTDAGAVRDVLLALVTGLKHRSTTRESFRERLTLAIGLLLR